MSPEQKAGEAESYEHLTDQELVEAYRSGEAPGREVMLRCLRRTGRTDYEGQPLPPMKGEVMLDESGEPARVEDYLLFAKYHGPAEAIICNFVAMDPGTPDYRTYVTAVSEMLDRYMGESNPQA